MSTNTYTLEWVANVQKYQAAIATIPGMTDKAAASAAVNLVNRLEKAQTKSAAAAEAAASKAARAWSKVEPAAGLDGALKDAGERAGDFESTIRALGGAIGAANPELGGMISTLGEFGGAAEASVKVGTKLLGGVISPLTAAIGTAGLAGVLAIGALAWNHYSEQVEQAEAKMSAAADKARELSEASRKLNREIADANLELEVASGAATKEAVQARDAQRRAELAYQAQRTELEGRAAEISGRILTTEREIEKLKRTGAGGSTEIHKLIDANAELEKQLGAVKGQIRGVDAQTADLAGTYLETTLTIEQKAEAERKAAKATQEAEAADRKHEATLKDLEARLLAVKDASAMEADPISARRDQALRELQLLEDKLAEEGVLTIEAGEVLAKRQAEISLGAAAERAEMHAKELEDAQRANEQASDRYISLVERELAKEAALREKQRRQTIDAALQLTGQLVSLASDATQRQASLYDDLNSQLESGAEDLTMIEKGELEKRKEAAAAAAMRAYEIEKKLRIASILMDAAAAGIRAVAELGPIAGGISAVSIGIGAVAALAAVENTEPPVVAHSGLSTDPMGMATDEVQAKLTRGERVLNPGAAEALGDERIARLNRGEGSGGAQTLIIQQQLGHRTFGRQVVELRDAAGKVGDTLSRGMADWRPDGF